MYEKADRIGGLLRYGIPDFKMEKWVLDRRLDQMQKEGVIFETGVCVGVDTDLERLRGDFDAVILAMGAEQPRELPVPGRELDGVHLAMDYLTQQNKQVAGDSPSGELISAKGKRVVVIGGGDTGSDCLGTAHRQGCLEAHQFELLPEPPPSRADTTPWPFWPMKLRTSHAHEEGCDRQWEYLDDKVLRPGWKGEGPPCPPGEIRKWKVRTNPGVRDQIGCGPGPLSHGICRAGQERAVGLSWGRSMMPGVM